MGTCEINSNLTSLNCNWKNETRFSHIEKKIIDFLKEGKSVREIAKATNLSLNNIQIKIEKIDAMLKGNSLRRETRKRE